MPRVVQYGGAHEIVDGILMALWEPLGPLRNVKTEDHAVVLAKTEVSAILVRC